MKDLIILIIFIMIFIAFAEKSGSEKHEESHPEIPKEEYYIGNTGIRNTPTGRMLVYGAYMGIEKFKEAKAKIKDFQDDYSEWERRQMPKNLIQEPDSLQPPRKPIEYF